MIDRAYLEQLRRDVQAQLAEHEQNAAAAQQNAAAARGALQILEHLLNKEAAATLAALPVSENGVKELNHEQ
jgi:DNA-binding TFAR19-related protein (PDSD5 family)